MLIYWRILIRINAFLFTRFYGRGILLMEIQDYTRIYVEKSNYLTYMLRQMRHIEEAPSPSKTLEFWVISTRISKIRNLEIHFSQNSAEIIQNCKFSNSIFFISASYTRTEIMHPENYFPDF